MNPSKLWPTFVAVLACVGCSDAAPAHGDDVEDAAVGDGDDDGDGDGDDEGDGDGSEDGGVPEPGEGPQFRVVDVALLYPRPNADESLLPLAFELDGESHTFLPEQDFEKLRQRDGALPLFAPISGEGLYQRLRVTALRADPCAESLAPAESEHCVRQVRLVAQEQYDDAKGQPASFADASLHLFFQPDDAAFVRFLAALHDIGTSIEGNPALDVHPTLTSEGLAGATAERLRRAITAVCTPRVLTKITLINSGPHGDDWLWQAVSRAADGTLAKLEIPGMEGDGDMTAASFQINLGDEGFAGFVGPLRDFPDAFLDTARVRALSESELRAGVAQLDAYLNPAREHPGTVACNGCHVAEHMQHSVRTLRADVALPPSDAAFSAPAGQNITGTRIAQIGKRNVHAFSYFGDEPTILARVIHESAASAAFLSSPAFRASLDAAGKAAWDEAFGD